MWVETFMLVFPALLRSLCPAFHYTLGDSTFSLEGRARAPQTWQRHWSCPQKGVSWHFLLPRRGWRSSRHWSQLPVLGPTKASPLYFSAAAFGERPRRTGSHRPRCEAFTIPREPKSWVCSLGWRWAKTAAAWQLPFHVCKGIASASAGGFDL